MGWVFLVFQFNSFNTFDCVLKFRFSIDFNLNSGAKIKRKIVMRNNNNNKKPLQSAIILFFFKLNQNTVVSNCIHVSLYSHNSFEEFSLNPTSVTFLEQLDGKNNNKKKYRLLLTKNIFRKGVVYRWYSSESGD